MDKKEMFIETAKMIIKEKGNCGSVCNKCPLFKNDECIAKASPYDMGENRERRVAFAENYLTENN